MAAAGRADVDIRDFQEALARLGNGVEGALNEAAMAGGLVVEGAAKQNIIAQDIIDTGATLNSVAVREVGEGEVEIGPATEYAIHHEFGTRYMAARPFMRPALDENQAAIEEAIAGALREAIRRAIR